MASLAQTLRSFFPGSGRPTRATPMQEMGVSGTAIFGGYVQDREQDKSLSGAEKWRTFSDILANTSIVAAGARHFLTLAAGAEWSVEPADDTPEAQEAAEFMESVLHDMHTPWTRIVRRSALFRFHGFSVQEWTGKRRDDGRIGFVDIESRPQHTIERWEVDDNGSIIGMWQVSPQTGRELFLPRQKVLYLVDDTFTDSPEGMGLLRQVADPHKRLKEYLRLEGVGFARDLRGIPVGRVPYGLIRQEVKAGNMSKADGDKLVKAIEDFVQSQAKDKDTSIVLDSAPYFGEPAQGGTQISTHPKWDVELLSSDASGLTEIAGGIDRLNREMARTLGVEHLLLGDTSGSRALGESKSRNMWQLVNATLNEIAEGVDRDIVGTTWRLNGLDDAVRPHVSPSDVSFRTVEEMTSALRDMATAGATLVPDDPAVSEVRDVLGLSHPPEMDPELRGALGGDRNGADPDADDLDDDAGATAGD